MFTKFKDFLFTHIDITQEEWNLIESKLTISTYKKNEHILNHEEVCDKIRFINSGITRMYYFDENAKEFTCQISTNLEDYIIDNFAIDYHSFTTQAKSMSNIEVLENAEIVEISFDDVKYLASKTTAFEQLHTKVTQLIHESMRNDLINVNTLSNDERYENFIEKYHLVHKNIPQYIIASFLGITPVALSRLKKRK